MSTIKFKEKLVELREKRGLTKSQLAQAIGTTRQRLTSYECGTTEPNITMLVTMADYFGVSADYLLGRKFSGGKTVTLPKGLKDYHVSMIMEFAESLDKHTPKE
jgi:transcriptional regulator with XRE-family HTH domain